jgi:type VI secretion system secreted protein VgrG
MATTQDDRLMAIHTPLGKDFLLINRFSANEGLSELFSYDIELLHEENEPGHIPTEVNQTQILGKAVTITIAQREDGVKREFTGIVSRFSQGVRDARFSFYYIKVVPHIWLLTQVYQSRIFQQKSVPDILKEVFQGFEVFWELQGFFAPRVYCVQYRESDFDFASRLMEEEGIYYYFEHSNGKHRMIVANTPQSHRDCPAKSSIPYFIDVSRNQEDFIASIHSWQSDYRLQTKKVTLWDYNFQLPLRKLRAEKPSVFNVGDNQNLELYDYPGGYARKFDGIDRTGAEQTSELQKIFEDNVKTAEIRMQELDSRHKVISGASDCSTMTSGYRFELTRHPNNKVNGKYVITSISHDAEQNPTYVSDEYIEQPYRNSFTCIAHGLGTPPFRPLRKTPKPIIQGSQTATVVGPAGEEIFTDKYGRVKVQFHWDRENQADATSSCWIRVAQSWASKKWGMMFVPRIGMEVIVHFLEGDPDQPIITGCVYNPETMPPYTLPDEKTKSTIKSNSSKGGSGFNEFRFEDKKDAEQIFIHAQKNQDVRVRNDCMETIMHDRHLIIENEQFEKVKKDKHIKVDGDHNEKVDGTISVKAGANIEERAGTKFAVDAGNEIHLKSGTSLTIETGTSLTLKVGGNFININSGGIFINGTMVMLNSGGAAGAGSGSNPEDPKLPKEADTAQAGQRVVPPPRTVPPQKPEFTSPAAIVLVNAAKSGKAFCEICSRQ